MITMILTKKEGDEEYEINYKGINKTGNKSTHRQRNEHRAS